MVEAQERFKQERHETRKPTGERKQFERRESRLKLNPEDRLKEAQRVNEIRLELNNHPLLAVVIPESKPAGKPDSQGPEKLSFWDILAMILEMILNSGKAILPKQAGENG